MAFREASYVYKEGDVPDQRLLNQISKWIMYHRLPSLARHLGISDAEISRIIIPSRTPEEQCFQVLNKWSQRTTMTVKMLVEAMLEWHHEMYLDPGVWDHLRARLHPNLLPAPSDLDLSPPELPPKPLEYLPHSALCIAEPQSVLPAYPSGQYQVKYSRVEVSTDHDTKENPSMKRRITTVLQETVCTENSMNSDQGHDDRTGTTLSKPRSSQLSALPCAISVARCEQPTHQAVTDPFIEQHPSSPLPTPSGEQSLNQTMVISGRNSNVGSSVSLSKSTSNSSFNPDTPATSAVPPAGKPTMRDPSFDQLSTAASVKGINSLLKRIQSQDHGAVHTDIPHHPVPTIVVVPSVEEFAEMQRCLKLSLNRTWRHSLTLDWISPEKAKSLPLLEFYVGLRWRKLEKAMKNYKVKLTSIYDILKVVDSCQDPWPMNILITAEPGMGKTCSLALLAVKWATGTGCSRQLDSFDLVFLIRLRYVKAGQSLAKIVQLQHDTLDETPMEHIQAVLKGKTKHKVLLMLDGYDEYTRGTNRDIDRAIESTIGKCLLILTSRSGAYVSKSVRDKMDGDVIIDGFSKESIQECSMKYLGSRWLSVKMLAQAETSGIDVLLHIPIILVMTVVVFLEEDSLPKTKTGIYKTIYRLAMDRTTLKTFGCKSGDIPQLEDLLYTLGEFSWKALQSDVQQLLLPRDQLEKKNPDLLKLGLVYEVGVDIASVRELPTLVSFQQKSLQEYSASIHITQRLQKTIAGGRDVKEVLREFFPSWYVMRRHEEVVVFTCGQMADPRTLIEHAYEMWIDRWLKMMRLDQMDHAAEEQLEAEGKDTESLKLFNSLQAESRVSLDWNPYHNRYLNRYDHRADGFKKRPRDITPVYSPSRLYLFDCIHKILKADTEDKKEAVETQKAPETIKTQKIADCAIRVYRPDPASQRNVLKMCEQICCKQNLTDLSLFGLSLRDFDDGSVFKMSRNVQSVVLVDCDLHADFLRGLLRQLYDCTKLRKLLLGCKSLNEVEKELDEVLENLITHHEREVAEHNKQDQQMWLKVICGADMSQDFKNKWEPRCKESSVYLSVVDEKNTMGTLTIHGYVRPELTIAIPGLMMKY